MRGLGARSTSTRSLGWSLERLFWEAPTTRYREHDIGMQFVWLLTTCFQAPSIVGKSWERTWPSEAGNTSHTASPSYSHRHIPQGVRGPHKLEPASPQLHSDFTPGCGRSFGQVYVVSGADEHLQSARQSPIIFMLLIQSDCRWVAKLKRSFKFFMRGS